MMTEADMLKESLIKGDVERVREYMKKEGSDVILDDKRRPIHYACEKGHIDIAKILITMKCDMECEDDLKRRPIHYACENGHIDIVKLLIEMKCDMEFEDNSKRRPIHYACENRHIDIAKLLITNKCDMECEDNRKRRSIHYACENGHVDIAKLLITNKCDIDCEDHLKRRPIHYACENGHIDIVKLLIEMGCDKKWEDDCKRRPIHYACENGHIDIVKLLITMKCDMECEDNRKRRPIHYACEKGHIDIVKLLITMKCDMECEDNRKIRPIHYACMAHFDKCEKGQIEIVKLLITMGCDMKCEDEEKLRPIHVACKSGNAELVKLLIDQKCNIECEDVKKQRPIHFACWSGDVEVVKLLMKENCNIHCTDSDNHTPFYWAFVNGHNNVMEILSEENRDEESEDKRKGIIADNMGLNCAKDCSHSIFCRESFLQYLENENWIRENWNEVGEGSFGKVYRLKESRSIRPFVLKRVEPDKDPEPKNSKPNRMVKRYLESYINICLDRLQHENIVIFFGTIERDNTLNIFMEDMEGGSLKHYINQNKNQRSSEWKYYCRKITDMTKQILQAVDFLHENRVIHRDIKPDNILLDRNQDKVKLSDFGVSRFCDFGWSSESSYGTECGTLGYIAPEIRKNERYNFSADIWSVGATLYHMLTGEVPPQYKYNLVIRGEKIQKEELYRLMTKMVKIVRRKRPTADELLRETIFVKGLDPGSSNSDELH